MILVDTNVWSELTKRQPVARVIAWLARHDARLHLSVIVIAEIRRGYETPKGQAMRPTLEPWLAELQATYRTEAFDARDAHVYGQLAARRTVGSKVLDLQLAAQGIARLCPVATRNVADFAWTGVEVIDPWQAVTG